MVYSPPAQSICREARSLRLLADSRSWKEDILDLWRDTIDADLAVVLHLVRPSPPCARTECVLAHVILEQSERPNYVVGLITVFAVDRSGDSTEHVAHSLPDLMNSQMVLRLADLLVFCRTRLCSVRLELCPLVWWTGTMFLEQLDSPFISDQSFGIRLEMTLIWCRVLHPPECYSLLGLLYWRAFPRLALCERERLWALCSSILDREQRRFVSIRMLFLFTQASLPLVRNQNLYKISCHLGSRGLCLEDEERSMVVQTFFVDHTDVIPTCSPGRSVRLFGSYSLWTEQLKGVWPDKVRAGRPIEFHICLAYTTTSWAWYLCLCLDGASTGWWHCHCGRLGFWRWCWSTIANSHCGHHLGEDLSWAYPFGDRLLRCRPWTSCDPQMLGLVRHWTSEMGPSLAWERWAMELWSVYEDSLHCLRHLLLRQLVSSCYSSMLWFSPPRK